MAKRGGRAGKKGPSDASSGSDPRNFDADLDDADLMGSGSSEITPGSRQRLAAWLSSNPLPPFEDEEIGDSAPPAKGPSNGDSSGSLRSGRGKTAIAALAEKLAHSLSFSRLKLGSKKPAPAIEDDFDVLPEDLDAVDDFAWDDEEPHEFDLDGEEGRSPVTSRTAMLRDFAERNAKLVVGSALSIVLLGAAGLIFLLATPSETPRTVQQAQLEEETTAAPAPPLPTATPPTKTSDDVALVGSSVSLPGRTPQTGSTSSRGQPTAPAQFSRSPLLPPRATPERGAIPRGTPVPPPPSLSARQTAPSIVERQRVQTPRRQSAEPQAIGRALQPPVLQQVNPGDRGTERQSGGSSGAGLSAGGAQSPQNAREKLPDVPDRSVIVAAEDALRTPPRANVPAPVIPPTEAGAKAGRASLPALGVRPAAPTVATPASPQQAVSSGVAGIPRAAIPPRRPRATGIALAALSDANLALERAVAREKARAEERARIASTQARDGDGEAQQQTDVLDVDPITQAALDTALGPLALRRAQEQQRLDQQSASLSESFLPPRAAFPPAEPPIPRIALLLIRLGETARSTGVAIQAMPRPVGLAVSPVAPSLNDWVMRARASGYEVLIDLSATGGVASAPAGSTLVIDSGSATEPYAGIPAPIAQPIGSPWQRNAGGTNAARAALASIGRSGLVFTGSAMAPVDAGTRPVPPRNIDLILDETAVRFAIEQQLAALEARARSTGSALGIARPFPITVEVLRDWLSTLPQKRITLVPPSALMTVPNVPVHQERQLPPLPPAAAVQ